VALNKAGTRSGLGLAIAVSLVFASLAGAPGCQGWEGDVIVAGEPNADPASLSVCPPETFQIRLLFSDGRLATYHPDAAATLTDVVQLSCGGAGTAGQPPASFAVDRHGDVWIVDAAGTLFRARRGTGTCLATEFTSASAGGPLQMAFVADAAAADKETLYVAIGTDLTAAGIPQSAELAPLTLAGAPVLGKRVKLGGWPILSGTGGDLSAGNGQLWGLFPATRTAEAYAAEIDPRTGALGPKIFSQQKILSPRLPSFVFWRGDFLVFPVVMDQPTTVGLEFVDPTVARSGALVDPTTPRSGKPAALIVPRNVELARLTAPGSSLGPSEVVSAAVSTCATAR
jgi:hypothetical protein